MDDEYDGAESAPYCCTCPRCRDADPPVRCDDCGGVVDRAPEHGGCGCDGPWSEPTWVAL